MKKLSKNCIKGELITNPNDIVRLALERRSFYTKNWGIKPFAILLSMQFRIIVNLIETKQLYTVINTNSK